MRYQIQIKPTKTINTSIITYKTMNNTATKQESQQKKKEKKSKKQTKKMKKTTTHNVSPEVTYLRTTSE